MVRKLPLALAIAAVLTPAGVPALGLGDIQPRSVLNQSFNADIELLSVKPGELDDVKVNLAPPEAFERAGVERTFMLSKLRFKPETKADGSSVIRVTSGQPIREPFLNFLVEVNWPKGRLVREYTVLLDPPVTLQKRAPAPIKAPQSSSPARTAPAPRTRVSEPAAGYSTSASSVGGAREYGPTQINDTLWKIAASLKSDDVSVEQMIMALWRNNPKAFNRNNVNSLRVGQVLRVPTDEDVRTLSRAEARSQFRGQIAAWRKQRGGPVNPRSGQVPGSQPASAAETPSTPQTVGVAAPKTELKLAAAPPQNDQQDIQSAPGATTDSESIAGLKNELLLARETGESARQEAQELRSRIGELEAQLLDVQRLLKLTNNQMARMQAAVGAEQEDVAPEAVAEVMGGETSERDLTGIIAEGTELGPDGGGETLTVDEGEDVAQTDMVEAAAPDGDVIPETSATGQEAVADVETIADTPAPVAAMPPHLESVDVSKSDRLLDTLMNNAVYLGLGAAGLVLLLGLVWMLLRRRRAEEAEFQESILIAEEDASNSQTQELFDAAGPASQRSDEVSFLSDFTPSGIDDAPEETSEVDPLSEADVYMTYGRYQQAEELVRDALARYPQRQDLKHKLVQIAFATKDVVTFSFVAEDLQKAGFAEAKPEAWQEIITMGRELVPQNILFGGQAEEAQTGAAAPEALEWREQQDTFADVGGSDIVRAAGELQPEASRDTSGLDFDIGLDINLDSPEAAEAALKELDASASDDLSLDLDLGELDNLGEMDNLQAGLGDPASAEELGIDGGLSLEDLEHSASQDIGEETSLDLSALENMDLPDLDQGEEFSLDLGESQGDAGQQGALTGDEMPGIAGADEVPAAGWSDEVNTKLDLARAYVDIGDAEGARSILGEVLSEGDESQKQEANELLEQLA